MKLKVLLDIIEVEISQMRLYCKAKKYSDMVKC
jgi:hypothetical protein